MSEIGFPEFGKDFVGFLHRHPSSKHDISYVHYPEMENHVVVDKDDWLKARIMFAKPSRENPFCDACKEPDCICSLDSTCEMIRKYLGTSNNTKKG